MTQRDIDAILRRLERIERSMEGNFSEAFTRLRTIELWRARLEGAQWAAGRLPVLIACASSLVAIALALHGH